MPTALPSPQETLPVASHSIHQVRASQRVNIRSIVVICHVDSGKSVPPALNYFLLPRDACPNFSNVYKRVRKTIDRDFITKWVFGQSVEVSTRTKANQVWHFGLFLQRLMIPASHPLAVARCFRHVGPSRIWFSEILLVPLYDLQSKELPNTGQIDSLQFPSQVCHGHAGD
jgi:hypothetical protein